MPGAGGPDGADDPATVASAADGEHFVYVLSCADGSLYTGYTTDVSRRVAEHNRGEGARYTRGRRPVELVHVEGFPTRSAACSREYELKQYSRAEKERLIYDGPPSSSSGPSSSTRNS